MALPQHQPQFRSVLPHEPLPTESIGYIHLQGAFEPKKKDPEAPNYWQSSDTLEQVLRERLMKNYSSLNLPHPATSLEVVDPCHPPFTKVRLTYECPAHAIAVQYAWRHNKISPYQLFLDSINNNNNSSSSAPPFSSGSFQVTVVTTLPLPASDETMYWTRSNPPKFRRLLHDHTDQDERRLTRFVFVSGLLSDPTVESSFWNLPHAASAAIRTIFNQYDTSGMGVEVFWSKKQQGVPSTCHVGMRSPQDCQHVISTLQGLTVIWEYQQERLESATLFLDYASVTQKSMAKFKAKQGMEWERGQPSRPECTSTTDSVHVPGLVVIEDYLTQDQEEVLMAVLTGPQAPWAPSQTNMSQTGAVKRLVQHYGYVFDYKTADVLRNRHQPGADCPPMPQPEDEDPVHIQKRIDEGHGWQVLADVVQKTRRFEFSIPGSNNEEKREGIVSYPNINQLTVNHYKPGEGIGSHVDTPSAFGDGLISISLNSGIVMEFRKAPDSEDEPTIKKLVYLPPRSLVLMSGAARYEWEHYIVTRRTDTHKGDVLHRDLRVSLTLRTAITLDGQPMPLVQSSHYPPRWGSDHLDTTSKKHLATPATERDHVHAVYDAIATQWHHTRGKRGVLWPGATQFLQRLPPGSIVADCGCGDGKYFPAIIEAGSYVIGTDISRPLLETAFLKAEETLSTPDIRKVSPHREFLRDRPAVAVADCMSIPLRDNSCDAAICIAVMHHLSTKERRIRCVEELARVVRVGGMINIQAWAMEQDESSRRRFAGTDVFVPFNAQPKYLDKVAQAQEMVCAPTPAIKETSGNKSVAELYAEAYEKADFDERKGLVVFQRYCHLYRKGEMEEIIESVKGVKLVDNGYECGNHFVILEVVKN